MCQHSEAVTDVIDKGDCCGVLSSDSVMDVVTVEEGDALGN